MRRYLRDPVCLVVSVEHRLVTDRHTTTAHAALAWRSAVNTSAKKTGGSKCSSVKKSLLRMQTFTHMISNPGVS